MTTETSYPLLKKIYDGISMVNDIIIKLSRNIEKIAGHIPEITASLLYTIFHFVISYFHEPWYDEAVSWQIAKCASVKDIIFTLPHYEGHPPLWHLILLPFAKLGCPYEFSLSLVSMIFAGASVMLIIWKSPFPRIIRLLLPFTYFFFYQYSVISRPYCVMMLAFVLTAITFNDRDTKPWKHILSLMLLCLSSAYGILFAGGITVAWLLGLLKKDGFRFLFDKKRTLSLLCLLLLAILLILEIFPASDTTAIMHAKFIPAENSLLMRLVYTLLVLPSDSVVTNFYSTYDLLSSVNLYDYTIIPAIITGIFIWITAIYFSRRKGTCLTLIIPYSLFAIFAAIKYLSPHHIGIAFLFGIFVSWCSCSRSNVIQTDKNKISESVLLNTARIAVVIFMAVSLYWSIGSAVMDIKYAYDTGKDIAHYIAENNLDDYNIQAEFDRIYEYDENGEITENIIEYNFNQSAHDNVLAYFDRNIFFNVNDGRDEAAYTLHKFSGLEDNKERIEKWRAQGAPDVLLSDSYEFDIIYEGIAEESDYVMVCFSEYIRIWKGSGISLSDSIYVRKELVEELGLKRAFE